MSNKNSKELQALIMHEGDEKYIIAEHEDRIALVSMAIDYHRGIMRAYRKQTDSQFTVNGGGILSIDHATKRIETYGSSGAYGEPDEDLVRHILEASYPTYLIDAKVTDYVRG